MPNSVKDPLFSLIKSFSKAEKRQFKLQSGRKEDALFVRLFEVIDKSKAYNEKDIFENISDLKKNQLSNLKAHLYYHLLDTLRTLDRQKDIRIALRDQVDYAQVLYNKGLYQQSLRMLAKAKLQASEHQEIELKMQILEFEKLIEARHITRSIENRAEQLSNESRLCIRQLNSLSKLSNLALNLYGMYLKLGHVRNEKEAVMLKSFFENNLPEMNIRNMTFYEKVNLFQAYSWYSYILQDFLMFYRYTQKWVDLFHEYPLQKQSDPALYIKALNNLLNAHFFNMNEEKFSLDLKELELFWKDNEENFNENTKTLAFVHTYTAKINKHFLEGTFTEGLKIVPEVMEQIKIHQLQLDTHRALVFYYKIACLYFGSGDNQKAIEYLNKIINLKIGNLRADIQCFARILHLIAHYELKNYSLMEYLLKSVYHFLSKHKDMSLVMEEILKFLRTSNHLSAREIRPAFRHLKGHLELIAKNPYERRSFLYLDIISWLESKISRRPVQDVIREKFFKKIPRI
ncbi:MAG: hypothetical protein ACRDE2_02710 [Chitinophagaceae bacterium]